MTTKKRILALFMSLLCLVSTVLALVSCADTDKGNTNNTEVKNDLEHLNNLDFGGEDVNFIIAGADNDDYHYRSIYIDENADDDAVNSEIYARNMWVQELLNVNIVVGHHANQNVKAMLGAQLMAGSDDYDVIAARQYDDIQLALDGVILDLNTLDQYGADYIKWDREYWATNYIDALSFGDKTYWLTGDLCLRYTGGYYAMFVNTPLYDTILKPKYGSIYDVVRNKDWTYDTLISMVSDCYEDDGDDKVGIEDQIGLMLPIWDNINGMSISAGVVYTRYDENGRPINNITSGNSVLNGFMEKCNELINTKGVYAFTPPSSSYPEAMGYFANGTVMFVSGRLNQAELYLRQMDDDYYVIPCPMLNKEQGAYYTGVHDAINIYGINYNIDDERIARTAATLEAMAYGAYKDIRPVYYDSFLKFKYTRDTEAAEMIDIMHDNVYTDFVFIWQFSADMAKLGSFLRNNVIKNSPASAIKKYVVAWNTGLEKILSRIDALE